ncbi:MAG: hypothetical protein QXF50_03045, partial [Sulfolobales archaeon]
ENRWTPGIITLGVAEGGVGIWDLDGVRYFAEIAYEEGKLPGGMNPDDIVRIVNETRTKYIPAYAKDLADNLMKMLKSGEIVFRTPRDENEYNSIISELLKGNLNAALEKGSIT